MLLEIIFVLELEEMLPLDLLINELDGLAYEEKPTDAVLVEEVFWLLVLVDDKRVVLLDLLEEVVEVLEEVFVDESGSLVLLDRVGEVVRTGFADDDDDLTIDLMDEDGTLVAEDDLWDVDEDTVSTLLKTHLQACFTAGIFQSGTGESVLGLLTTISKM